MAASVTTNTAIDLVRQSTNDFVEKYPRFKENQALQQLTCQTVGLLRGQPMAEKSQPDDPYNMNLAEVAEWSYVGMSMMLAAFCQILEPREAPPAYNPRRFGQADPKADHTTMNARERFNEDRRIVLEELTNFAYLAKGGLYTSLPVIDEVTSGLVEMMSSKEIPIWLGFGMQIYLDVYHALKIIGPNPFNELQATGTRVSNIIASDKAFSMDIPTPPGWPKVNEDLFDAVGANLKEFLFDDYLIKLVGAARETGGQKRAYPEHVLLSRHYILCGTLMFDINLIIQELGIYLSNAWVDSQVLAYLYNILRQELPGTQWDVTGAWPDMEQFIAIHGEEFLFMGGRPTTIEDSLKRLMLSQGISATAFASDRRSNRPASSRGGRRQIESTALMANLFRGRYCRRSDLNFSAEIIQQVLVFIESKGSKESDSATTFIRKKWDKTHTLGPIQLLSALQIQLSNEEPKLLFNYVGMHQCGIEILRLIKAKDGPKFIQYFGPQYIQNETQIAGLVTFVHHVAKMSGKVPISRVEGTPNKSRMLMSCGDVLRQYLKKNGDVATKELMQLCKRRDLLVGVTENQEGLSTEWVSYFALEEVLGPAVVARMQTGVALG